jgi:hypothetical protein
MRAAIVVATVMLFGVSPSQATELCFVEVSQVFFEPNGGFQIRAVTYTAMLGSLQPGIEIRFMDRRNVVPGDWHGTDLNQNVMSLLGVTIEAQDRSDNRTWRGINWDAAAKGEPAPPDHAVIDTMQVKVHFENAVDAFKPGAHARGVFLMDVMDAEAFARNIVECAIVNARRARPRILNLAIEFRGLPELRKLNRIYPVQKP